MVFEQLKSNGKYAGIKRSQWLPVHPEDVHRWLLDEDSSDDVEWRKLTEWAKGLVALGGDEG